MSSAEKSASKAKTGIWGLDEILAGGFSRGHLFLVEGAPGTGKTTIALQFLMEGARAGEKCLYITLSETERELRDGAASHGWALGTASRCSNCCRPKACSIPSSSRACSIRRISNSAKPPSRFSRRSNARKPSRVVLDSLSEIRLLAQSSLRYRRQILAIKHYFAKFNTTVMLLDDLTAEAGRQDRAQRRPWRDPAGGTGAGLWRGAAARCASSNIAA